MEVTEPIESENGLRIFNSPEFGNVRTVMIDGEPWFVAADVCKALELDKTWNALQRLDDDEKGTTSISTLGGIQNMSIVNEPGLYTLVIGSKKSSAKAFRRWITHDVVPKIRKHGMYATDELLNNPELAIKVFQKLKEERDRNRELTEENRNLLTKRKLRVVFP